MLRWEGKVILFGGKSKEVDNSLKSLPKRNIRLKASRRIQLLKLKSRLEM